MRASTAVVMRARSSGVAKKKTTVDHNLGAGRTGSRIQWSCCWWNAGRSTTTATAASISSIISCGTPSSITAAAFHTSSLSSQSVPPHSSHDDIGTSTTGNKPPPPPFYGRPLPPFQPTHPSSTRLSSFHRIGLAISSSLTAITDPTRADAIATLGEVTGTIALQSMYHRMLSDSTGTGVRILHDRPLVDHTSIDLVALKKKRGGGGTGGGGGVTFGQAYATFMERHGFDPEERTDVRYIDDPDLAYVMTRYRQCHDFLHVLFDLPPTVLGELALKYVELFQTNLPMTALSVTAGPLFTLTSEERDVLRNAYLPWAVRVGRDADFLLCVYFEEEFDTDLDELRRRLRIETAPPVNIITP